MHVHPAAIHPLAPGAPEYMALKVAAVGSLFGLRAFLVRRERDSADAEAETPPPSRQPHPVSRRKRKRRKRR